MIEDEALELELTQEELNHIFFGSDEPVKDSISPLSEDTIDKNINKKTIKLASPTNKKANEPQKLTRKKRKKRKPKAKKTDVPVDPNAPVKRPHGRPKIWTEEKIAQKKAENKRLAKLRRIKKLEDRRIAQLTGHHPTTQYERDQKVNQSIQTQDDIEEHILKKRKFLKGALNRTFVEILDKKNKCTDHLYQISYLQETTQDPVARCVYCSKEKHFTAGTWRLYHLKNRSRL